MASRNTEIPQLEFYLSPDRKKVSYHYTQCIGGFNLPLVLKNNSDSIKIFPTGEWKTTAVTDKQTKLFDSESIEKKYYISVKKSDSKK
ncbi:MAG TPA: hypothetical protein VGI82_02745 [Chitinophagaceae bacterium]